MVEYNRTYCQLNGFLSCVTMRLVDGKVQKLERMGVSFHHQMRSGKECIILIDQRGKSPPVNNKHKAEKYQWKQYVITLELTNAILIPQEFKYCQSLNETLYEKVII
jgi:hypothetical protein